MLSKLFPNALQQSQVVGMIFTNEELVSREIKGVAQDHTVLTWHSWSLSIADWSRYLYSGLLHVLLGKGFPRQELTGWPPGSGEV